MGGAGPHRQRGPEAVLLSNTTASQCNSHCCFCNLITPCSLIVRTLGTNGLRTGADVVRGRVTSSKKIGCARSTVKPKTFQPGVIPAQLGLPAIQPRTSRTILRSDQRILSADIFGRDAKEPRTDLSQHHEAGRDIPVYRACDVLVVGGGPSGTAAAVAAARTGADVVLLERNNHLGGLSTGGLVIWIDRMGDWQGDLVIGGLAEELFKRLPPDAVAGPERGDWGSTDAAKAAHWSPRTAACHGIVTRLPTLDSERLKLLSQQTVIESGAKPVLTLHEHLVVVWRGRHGPLD